MGPEWGRWENEKKLALKSGHVNSSTQNENQMGGLFSPFEGKKSSNLCSGSCLFRGIVGFPTRSNIYSDRKQYSTAVLWRSWTPIAVAATGATLPASIMSLEAARDLSIQDLLHVLNEKLSLEWARIRTIPTSYAVPTASLESEVSTRRPILAPMRSNSHGLHRLTASKPEHMMF